MIHTENIEWACLEGSGKFWRLCNITLTYTLTANTLTLSFIVNDFFAYSDLIFGYFSKILVLNILFMVTCKKNNFKTKLDKDVLTSNMKNSFLNSSPSPKFVNWYIFSSKYLWKARFIPQIDAGARLHEKHICNDDSWFVIDCLENCGRIL